MEAPAESKDAKRDAAAETPAAAEGGESGGNRPRVAGDGDDSDEGLCDVDFPVFDDVAPVDMDRGSNDDAAGSEWTPSNMVDEGAIVRCLGLSVDAHVKRRKVAAFEPMPPKVGEPAKHEEDGSQSGGGNYPAKYSAKKPVEQPVRPKVTEKGEWFPAPLPLPSWAKDIQY